MEEKLSSTNVEVCVCVFFFFLCNISVNLNVMHVNVYHGTVYLLLQNWIKDIG